MTGLNKKKAHNISVICSKLKSASLLFAYFEVSKAEYWIRMAQLGENINPVASAQRVVGLRQFHNNRLSRVKELYLAVSTTTNKTKKISREMSELISKYYPENTDSVIPDGYDWPPRL